MNNERHMCWHRIPLGSFAYFADPEGRIMTSQDWLLQLMTVLFAVQLVRNPKC